MLADTKSDRKHPLIAIVDHEAVFIRLMETILESAGYDHIACPSSQTSHDEIKRAQPDLIILDTWLETRDAGWQLLQTLWLDPGTDDIPILITSSDDRDRFEQRAEQLAGKKVGVLHKPFDPEMLLRAIAAMLDGNYGLQGPK